MAYLNSRITFTGPFNLAGVPAISVPCGFTESGLPLGIQIVGKAVRRGDPVPGGPCLRAGDGMAPAPAADLGDRGYRGRKTNHFSRGCTMADDIGVMEAIYSQRQITRYRRDPVSREDIERIIDAAIRAPSGGNTQPWHFIAITDRELIEKIGGLYRDIWLGAQGVEPPPNEPPAYQQARQLAHRMPEVPAMILVCVDHSRGHAGYTPGEPIERGRYASSIWLAIQNLFLAARALGSGNQDHHGAHPGRGTDQGVAGHPGARGDGVPDAAGISARQLRPHAADAGRGGQLLQSVRQPVIGFGTALPGSLYNSRITSTMNAGSLWL